MSGWSMSTGTCIRIRCATPLPPTCWPTGPTCAPFRSCLGIPRFPPRSAILTLRFANSSRCTIRPIPAPELGAGTFCLPVGLSDDGRFGFLPLTPAEEEADVPCAALAATERPKEQRRGGDPLRQTAAVGPQDMLSPPERAPAKGGRKRNAREL